MEHILLGVFNYLLSGHHIELPIKGNGFPPPDTKLQLPLWSANAESKPSGAILQRLLISPKYLYQIW